MAVNLDNVQGDTFSRGFPKIKETYYFFSIAAGKEKDFTKALNKLATSGNISNLTKVLADWKKVDEAAAKDKAAVKDANFKETIVEVSNASIGFSKAGLDKIQAGLTGSGLNLDKLTQSDPAFAGGMATDQHNLGDPASSSWDDLFKTPSLIHGILKVAGNSTENVDSKLNAIKGILGSTIADIPATSAPTTVKSRADGQVRPKELKLNGHEHFGFEDGISQPLLKGIDKDDQLKNDQPMQTPQNVITVPISPAEAPPIHAPGSAADPKKRPSWMKEGSFLVFRKLEQDVPGFVSLTEKFAKLDNTTPDHAGAKLMGRWKSGAPAVLFEKDAPTKEEALKTNVFTFNNNNLCPLGAHIRKTNPRLTSPITTNARIVRNGIPYGAEISVDPNGKRGLLFACYQSSIENGYQFIQKSWVNSVNFPEIGSGFDVVTAQPPGDGLLHINLFDQNQKPLANPLPPFAKVVTMKGGEYFFVPSIDALKNTLGSV